MSIVYVLITALLTIYNRKRYHTWISPITVFIYPWTLMIVFYELKLIKYYDLSIKTNLIIFCVCLLYISGVLMGSKYGLNKTIVLRLNSRKRAQISEIEYKRLIRKQILVTTIIGFVSTGMALISIINKYGLDFYSKITTIYSDRLTGSFQAESISYIGSMVYVAVILAGIYYSKYGFHPIMVPVFILMIIKPFISGARQSLVQCIVLLAITFLLSWKDNKSKTIKYFNRNSLIKRLLICFTGLVLLSILLYVSNQRSEYIVSSAYINYISPGFRTIVERVPGIYQLYSYFASPLGVLNEFLKSPDFSFGANSLFPFYNLLNKFGFSIPVRRYQPFYYIPIPINVGTAVRELIEDYSYVGILLFFVFGFFIGSAYRKFQIHNSLKSRYLVCFLFFLVSMSWYMWFLRDANLIIALIVGCIVCDYDDMFYVVGSKSQKAIIVEDS